MDNVIILGAGLSGLGCARTLKSCRVFEARDRPGGHAASHELQGVWFDEGAHISHTRNQDFLDLIYRTAGDVHRIHSSIVANYWKGQRLTYPVQNHLHELPLDLRMEALTDLVMAHVEDPESEPEDYEQWCRRQYGNFLTDNFYSLYTRKYWRADMKELATDWLGGRLLPSVLPRIVRGAFVKQEETQTAFARFHYPARGGFARFFQSLYEDLDIQYGQSVAEIDLETRTLSFNSGRSESFEFLASSVPLPRMVSIIKDPPASVREAASRLRHTKLLCVNLLVSKPDLVDHHWCYLYDPEIHAARVSFPSLLAPKSVEPGITAIQAEIFRRHDETWNIRELTEKTARQMAALFGFSLADELIAVAPVAVPYAYVISDHARQPAVDHILAWLREQRIYSMGLYGKWQYIWSDVAYDSGVETARELLEVLNA
jgi:protoporphyrinogen oxidase